MGGRGASSGMSKTPAVKNQSGAGSTFQERAEAYVGGGYDVTDAFTPADIKYMKGHETTYSQPLYRLEEARFTARQIDGGDEDIDFGSPYRSFTKGGQATLDSLGKEMEEAFGSLDDYVVLRTVGKTSAFDMGKYAKNYTTDQKEVLTGGDFEYLGEGTITVNGKKLRRIDIRQYK